MAKNNKSGDGGNALQPQKLTHSPFAALGKASAAAPVTPPPEAEPPKAQPTQAAPAKAAQAEPRAESARVEPGAKSRGRLVLRRETKHRGGKAVIIVRGFEELRAFDDAAIEALAKQLKQSLGCGGTVESAGGKPEIILQGDRAAKVAELLRARGFRVDGVTS
jgi:translation initiation factor 1 (eIF-1/SUI1)